MIKAVESVKLPTVFVVFPHGAAASNDVKFIITIISVLIARIAVPIE